MRTEAEATEAFEAKVQEIVASMTPANWILLRGHLDMSREEISNDPGLTLVLIRWKEMGPTRANLAALLETPEGEIAKDLGMDPNEEFLPDDE